MCTHTCTHLPQCTWKRSQRTIRGSQLSLAMWVQGLKLRFVRLSRMLLYLLSRLAGPRKFILSFQMPDEQPQRKA